MSLFGGVRITDHIMRCMIEFFYLFIRSTYAIILNTDNTLIIVCDN